MMALEGCRGQRKERRSQSEEQVTAVAQRGPRDAGACCCPIAPGYTAILVEMFSRNKSLRPSPALPKFVNMP